jgi:hypothetical protein
VQKAQIAAAESQGIASKSREKDKGIGARKL